MSSILAPLEKLARVVLLISEIAELLALILLVFVEILDVLVAISLSLDAMLVELVLMLDSTSVIFPSDKEPSIVAFDSMVTELSIWTAELNVVAFAIVPPVKAPPAEPWPTALPFQYKEPFSFSNLSPPIYKSPVTNALPLAVRFPAIVSAFRTDTVPIDCPKLKLPVEKSPYIKFVEELFDM